MNRNKALLALALCLFVASSVYLESMVDSQAISGKRPLHGAKDVGLLLVQMLGIRELALGFLWIQFDTDSALMLGNSHRLLPTLDAITWLDPNDLDAWGLKTFMRINRAKNKRPDLVEAGIKDFAKAVQANPESWEFPFEMGRQLYFTLASPSRALPYLEKAAKISDHHIKVDKLHLQLLISLKKNVEALSLLQNILKKPDLEPIDRKIFEERLKEVL